LPPLPLTPPVPAVVPPLPLLAGAPPLPPPLAPPLPDAPPEPLAGGIGQETSCLQGPT
jgi:hypothetical protein